VATYLGVLVRTPTSWQLWHPPDQEGAFDELRSCTIANDMRAVACVRAGRVILMRQRSS